MATLTSYLTPGPFQPGSSTDRRTTYRAPGPLQPQLSVAFNVTGSGGLTLGGSATANTGFNVTGSGGLTLSGSGSSSAAYRINGSGGLTLGGTAPAALTFNYVASGGLTLGGTATTTFSDLSPIYWVWQGDSSGSPIDYTASPTATTHNLTWTSSALASSTITRFAVRVYDPATNLDDGNVDAQVRVTLSSAGLDVSNTPNAPTSLTALATSSGTAAVKWAYLNPPGSTNAPSTFAVYLTAGTTVNFASTPAATVNYLTGVNLYQATLSGLTDGSTYAIAVRATNASGTDTNTNTVTIVGSTSGPSPVDTLAAIAI